MQGDILESTLRELELMFQPLSLAATEPDYLVALLRRLGWSIDDLLPALSELTAGLGGIKNAVTAIRAIADGGSVDLALIGNALSRTAGIPAAVLALEVQLTETLPAMAADLGGLASEILELLFTDWLIRRSKLTYAALAAVGVITQDVTTEKRDATNRILRHAVLLERMHLEAIPDWISNPSKKASALYGFAGMTDEAAARAYAARLFPLLALLGAAIGATPRIGRAGPLRRLDDDDEQSLAHMLSLEWSTPLDDGAEAMLGMNVAALSAVEEGPGLVLMPHGDAVMNFDAAGWSGTAELGGNLPWVLLKSDGVAIGAGGVGDWEASLLVKRPGAQNRIGGATGTRLELGDVSVEARLKLGATQRDIALGLATEHAKLVIAAGDGDGFLAKMLPAKGVDIDFDFGLLWTLSTGLRLKGAAEMDAVLPLNLDFGGVLFLDSLAIHVAALAESGTPRFEASLGLSLTLTLGPLSATVDRVGMQLDITAPPEGGNAGPVHTRIGFKPPTGIGIVVDATAVKGGGFLSLDYERQQYAGVLELSIQNTIDVKAIGILNARLPDGRPGFSLLLIVTGEFPPLPLGMGFTLNGLGGLIGINRTAAVDVLRAGLRNGAMDAVLFPPNPLANVPALLGTIGAVFPVAEGRFVFGPMAKIGWGSPTLITLDIALILEVPDPVRIILLGRLKVVLPDPDRPVVQIRMDAIGVLDFGRGELSLDATLYDSRILAFTITGDMALRIGWGREPAFLLSVGGFHPHFQPPTGMPKLARLAIVLIDQEKDGITARVRFETYLAITSNTTQFGARVDACFKALGVEVVGFLSFDALLHWPPLTLEAELAAVVAVSFNGIMLMGASIDLTLTGPEPWHLVGEATFAFLGAKVKAPIEIKTGSESQPAALPDPVDVAALLVNAIKDPRNWQCGVSDAINAVARVRPALAAADKLVMVHPLGTLAVRQRVVPLAMRIDRFGPAPVPPASRYLDVMLGDGRSARDLEEQFAIAQFTIMRDDQKLAAPSFEPRKAGLDFHDDGFIAAPTVQLSDAFAFETRFVPARATPVAPAPNALNAPLAADRVPKRDSAHMDRLIALGAAAKAPTRTTGKARYVAPATT